MKESISKVVRYECADEVVLITHKTLGNKLWFIETEKNKELYGGFESRVLSYLAKCQNKYGIVLYSFVLSGNHYHMVASFPKGNRASFAKDFHARVAEAAKKYFEEVPEGPFWAGRYKTSVLPLFEDIEKYYYYCALQPVNHGICRDIKNYTSYNSYGFSSKGVNMQYRFMNWGPYVEAKRYNKDIDPAKFEEIHTLTYSRLPSYQKLSQHEYEAVLNKELLVQKELVIQRRKEAGMEGFLTPEKAKEIKQGSQPLKVKSGKRNPLVLSICAKAKEVYLESYFEMLSVFKKSSQLFRSGQHDVEFPEGTYRPPNITMTIS
jgi:hypothetical protein